jgi:CBS domain-containing protein
MAAPAEEGAMEFRCPKCRKKLPSGVPPSAKKLKVGDVMTREPVTLGPEESLMRGLEVMRMNRIRRVPIVLGSKLIGLLTEGDLKRAEPSTLSESEEDFNRVMEETPVSRIMIKEPVTVEREVLLVEATRTLLNQKFGALPVVSNGLLVGILTDVDVLRCLEGLLSGR